MSFSQVFCRVELAFFTAAPTPKSGNLPWKKRCPGIALWLERRHFWPWSSKKKLQGEAGTRESAIPVRVYGGDRQNFADPPFFARGHAFSAQDTLLASGKAAPSLREHSPSPWSSPRPSGRPTGRSQGAHALGCGGAASACAQQWSATRPGVKSPWAVLGICGRVVGALKGSPAARQHGALCAPRTALVQADAFPCRPGDNAHSTPCADGHRSQTYDSISLKLRI